ncbi:MAG: hypothetical protein GOMPHAMPRED_004291 [Gomphillus americanus]|uniref:Uncharacterized protein n=1 Tax=Gomphillus americanus TaxID=1940652 RepID=A0A8H3IPV0_9LECA|nr:MAG: hypothetical protein GOMPHAMPRED_004291 [Gomphillus americanus]
MEPASAIDHVVSERRLSTNVADLILHDHEDFLRIIKKLAIGRRTLPELATNTLASDIKLIGDHKITAPESREEYPLAAKAGRKAENSPLLEKILSEALQTHVSDKRDTDSLPSADSKVDRSATIMSWKLAKLLEITETPMDKGSLEYGLRIAEAITPGLYQRYIDILHAELLQQGAIGDDGTARIVAA